MSELELKRANKVTAYWQGEGIAVAQFYKTHDKVATVKSDDDAVKAAGFVMPEKREAVAATDTTPAVEAVTANNQLEAFKDFVTAHATVFGVTYDPVDRRSDAFKFPGHYDETTFAQYAKVILGNAIETVLKSLQDGAVAKMIKNGNLPSGTALQYGIGDAPAITVTEKYSNGNIKYAVATFDVAFGNTTGTKFSLKADVNIVSGQLKKPRQLGDTVLTATGLKTLLVDNQVLPKIEKEVKDEPKEAAAAADAGAVPAPAQA